MTPQSALDRTQLPLSSSSTAVSNAPYSALPGAGARGNHHHKRHPSRKRNRVVELVKRPAASLSLVALAVLALVVYSRSRDSEPDEGDAKTAAGHFVDSFERLSKGWRSSSRRPVSNDDREWACNPFEQNGRLVVDGADTTWVPFDDRCPPSNLMKSLYRAPGDDTPLIPDPLKSPSTRQFLPWFRNRTVVLHGDSIDRFHLKDFCEFVGGRLELVTPEHAASPALWKKPGADAHRREQEDRWAARPREGWELTNPWVCDVPEYGTTLVNVFTWGLEGAEEFFEMERWYYPPGQ